MEKLYQLEVENDDKTEIEIEFNSLEFEGLKYLAKQKNMTVENFIISVIKNKCEENNE